jgi:hypothetical protein
MLLDGAFKRKGVISSKELHGFLRLKHQRPTSGLFMSKYENPEGTIINKAGQAHTDPKIEAIRRQFKLEERQINAGKSIEQLSKPKFAWDRSEEAKKTKLGKQERQDQKERQVASRRKREQKRRWKERTQQAGTKPRAAIAPMSVRVLQLAVPIARASCNGPRRTV